MEFGLSGSFADTMVNVSTWISQWWNALVSESGRACQHNSDSFSATAHPTRDPTRRETTAQRDGGSVRAQWCEVGQGPIAHYLQPSARILAPMSVATVLARVWDEALVSFEA
jgi:hypothetical protein